MVSLVTLWVHEAGGLGSQCAWASDALCYEATTAAHRRLPSRRQIVDRRRASRLRVSSVWHALQHEPGQASCVAAPLHGCCKSTLDSAMRPGSVGRRSGSGCAGRARKAYKTRRLCASMRPRLPPPPLARPMPVSFRPRLCRWHRSDYCSPRHATPRPRRITRDGIEHSS
jgi:hypothetical protein